MNKITISKIFYSKSFIYVTDNIRQDNDDRAENNINRLDGININIMYLPDRINELTINCSSYC